MAGQVLLDPNSPAARQQMEKMADLQMVVAVAQQIYAAVLAHELPPAHQLAEWGPPAVRGAFLAAEIFVTEAKTYIKETLDASPK